MPIEVRAQLRNMSADDFAKLAFEVMGRVFAVHNEIGRFFDERIYKQEVARRFSGIKLEVPVIVSFEDFRKTYFLDMLVRDGAIFELKAAERLGPQDRAQSLNYLLLCELPRAKLVNVRGEQVEHEFVNTSLRRCDRVSFQVDESDFIPLDRQDQVWKDWVTEVLRDWGTCLDVHLYEDALTHALGGEERVVKNISIVIDGCKVGTQKARLTQQNSMVRVTTLSEADAVFEEHASRFLAHTNVEAFHWVNVARTLVTFRTLKRKSSKAGK